MTQPVQEESPERAVGALDYKTRQLARRPPTQKGATSMPDFAQIAMTLQQIIPQSTAWTGVGYNGETIDWDYYLVAPGGPTTEDSPTGAFHINTTDKRLELRKTGIYHAFVQLGETGEWLGTTDFYSWTLIASGAGVIWNNDDSFPINMFEANAVWAEWYKSIGPLIVTADETHPVKLDIEVAQQQFNPAVLNSIIMSWTYVSAFSMDPDTYDVDQLADQQMSM